MINIEDIYSINNYVNCYKFIFLYIWTISKNNEIELKQDYKIYNKNTNTKINQ